MAWCIIFISRGAVSRSPSDSVPWKLPRTYNLERLGRQRGRVNLSNAMALGDSETAIDVSWQS